MIETLIQTAQALVLVTIEWDSGLANSWGAEGNKPQAI